MLGFKSLHIQLFELLDLRGLKFIKITSGAGVEDASLLFDLHWYELVLLEQFSKLFTSVKKLLGSGIEIGTELSESGNLTILSQFEFERTGKHFHSLDLGGRSYS